MWPTSELAFPSEFSKRARCSAASAKCVSNNSSWVFFWRLLCLEYILKIFNLLSESYLQSSSQSQFMVNTFEKFHTSFIKSLRLQGEKKYVLLETTSALRGKYPKRTHSQFEFFSYWNVQIFQPNAFTDVFNLSPCREPSFTNTIADQNQMYYQFVLPLNVSPNLGSVKL